MFGNEKNNTTTLVEYHSVTVLKVVLLVLSSVSLLANLLLASFITLKFKSILKRKSNKFLFNLAISDACVSTTTVCFSASIISEKIFDSDIIFHNKHKHWLILIAAFAPISILNLMLLTIDRLIAIKMPFFYADKFMNKHVYCFISISWIFAVVDILTFEFLIVYLEVSHEVFITFVQTCLACFISVGFLTLSLSNIFIFIDARRQLRFISTVTSDQLNQKYLLHAKECRLIRMTFGLAITYLICWLPCFTISIYFLYTKTFKFMYMIGVWIAAHMNHLLNPIIYVSVSYDIKADLRKYFFKAKINTPPFSFNNFTSDSFTLDSLNYQKSQIQAISQIEK
ncbi:histamine H2 receptor [Hydra vulgaris]|uniref:histamine H2 receptor n=1 Tax=Hydra vulgaris TaxID=6087 RepID=UPI001F5F4484|nr:histamine H2 receptor-like [Hydra vulgaris]